MVSGAGTLPGETPTAESTETELRNPFGEGQFDLDRELGLVPVERIVPELGLRARRLAEMKGFPQRFWERV